MCLPACCTQLIEHGADVNSINYTRACSGAPLHEAVINKCEPLVDLLVKHGASPFIENMAGRLVGLLLACNSRLTSLGMHAWLPVLMCMTAHWHLKLPVCLWLHVCMYFR